MLKRLRDLIISNPFFTGLVSGAGLLGFYALILIGTESVNHFIQELQNLWYLIFPLIGFFGLQTGLFSYMSRQAIISKKELAASGGISGGAMIACCTHHIFELLPLIGLTGFALLFADLQAELLMIGVLSGLSGTAWMLKIMYENSLYRKNGFWSKLMRFDFRILSYAVISSSVLIMLYLVYIIGGEIL